MQGRLVWSAMCKWTVYMLAWREIRAWLRYCLAQVDYFLLFAYPQALDSLSTHFNRSQGADDFVCYASTLDDHFGDLGYKTALHASTGRCPDARSGEQFALGEGVGHGRGDRAAGS